MTFRYSLPDNAAGTGRDASLDLRVNGTLAQERAGDLEVRLVLRRLPVQQQPGRHQPAPLLRRDPDPVRADPAGRHEGPAPGHLDRRTHRRFTIDLADFEQVGAPDRQAVRRAGRGRRLRRRPDRRHRLHREVPGRGRRRPRAGQGGLHPAGHLHGLGPHRRRQGDPARRRARGTACSTGRHPTDAPRSKAVGGGYGEVRGARGGGPAATSPSRTSPSSATSGSGSTTTRSTPSAGR